MAAIGEVKINNEFEWKIPHFSLLPDENSVCQFSPTFSFSNEYWCLRFYPNGIDKMSIGYISLYLRKKSSGLPIKVKFSLGLKTCIGLTESEQQWECIFEKAEKGYGFNYLLSRSELFEKKADLLLHDAITLFCSVKSASLVTPVENSLFERSFLWGDILDADNLSVLQKLEEIAVRCLDCSAVSTLENWRKHECDTGKRNCNPVTPLGKDHSSKILEDFKQLFLNEKECDVVIRIEDHEFSAHKAILIARSSVFESTFRNKMKTRRPGIIEIEDCDPSYFQDFLRFLYCGDSESISQDNVFKLFATADKYDVKDLKEECIEFIKKNMSVDIFCDAFTLALEYSETELNKVATDFFTKNLQKIILTAKWQSFLEEYTTQGNELLIKALVTEKRPDM